jgi:hypothetical protein
MSKTEQYRVFCPPGQFKDILGFLAASKDSFGNCCEFVSLEAKESGIVLRLELSSGNQAASLVMRDLASGLGYLVHESSKDQKDPDLVSNCLYGVDGLVASWEGMRGFEKCDDSSVLLELRQEFIDHLDTKYDEYERRARERARAIKPLQTAQGQAAKPNKSTPKAKATSEGRPTAWKKAESWSDSLRDLTRSVLWDMPFDAILGAEAGGRKGFCLKSLDGRFGYVTLSNCSSHHYLIQDHDTDATLGDFTNIDDLLKAGWAVD